MAKKGCKSELELARQACLYGEGDGKPVMNAARLAEISGMHVATIWKHMPTWQAEREEILANSSKHSLALSLSKKELDLHESDMKTLRSEIQQVKWELHGFDGSVAKLEKLIERISDVAAGDPAAVGQLLSMFDKYLRFSLNKQNLRKQFLALQKQWTALSGVDGLQDVALTRERELEKGRVKIKLRQEGAEVEPRNVGPVTGGVFARRVLGASAQEVTEVEGAESDS